jgi:rhodanese-related sulfurtransferase
VWVIDQVSATALQERGATLPEVPEPPEAIQWVAVEELARWLEPSAATSTVVVDLTTSANYVARHIPGAWFALRSELAQVVSRLPPAERYVLTCGSSLLARYAADELSRLTDASVHVLRGGTLAWIDAKLPLEHGETHLASARIDRYRRPYEGTDNPREAMQAYLDWEFGLVEQLGRDATHGFRVL